MYRYILLDLDGTLIDSQEGITNSLRYSFEKIGIEVPCNAFLKKFVGPPLHEAMQEFCHLSKAQVDLAMEYFFERYLQKGLYENTPTAGAVELCKKLNSQGYILAIASSKPVDQCISICNRFGFSGSMTAIVGSEPCQDWSKEDVIRKALEILGIAEDKMSEVLMVGDRKYDVYGAKACGINCLGVNFFNYAEPGELQKAGACTVVTTLDEMESFIKSNSYQ